MPNSFQLGAYTQQGVAGPGIAPGNTTTMTANVRAVSGTDTIGASDFTILADGTGAAFTETLPAAVSYPGRIFNIKKIDASANVITVGTTGGNTIDGAATKTLTTQWQSLMVQSNGANWFVI